jgi:predicted MFS family arabinose efflux permease
MIKRPAYRHYVLIILMLTLALSIADRLVMSILMEDIKAEFSMTDTQMGLLAGLAFTLFYAILGIPIARLADRFNRKNIVAASLTIWSGMTALCGAATGFATLFAARIGVGIGEAGGGPPSVSIISDYFRTRELARAVAVYSLGATLGTVLGLIGGGFLADLVGWRMTFVYLGVPGILLGLILFLTIREPERGAYVSKDEVQLDSDSFGQSLASLARNKIYVRLVIGSSLAIVAAYAYAIWLAPIILRNFEFSTANVGLYLGLTFLVGGVPGMLIGGYLADKLATRNKRWRAWVPGLALPLALPALVACLLVEDIRMVLGLYAVGYALLVSIQGPSISLMQIVVKPGERALAIAFYSLATNLMGQALGPVIVGSISDQLQPEYGPLSLNYAVIALTIIVMIPAALFYAWSAAAMPSEPEVH